MDGDVEEDVDFVRFMIGWQKSEVGDFFAMDCLVPSTPTRKRKPSLLIHDLDCLTA